jgi:hypothetical protein
MGNRLLSGRSVLAAMISLGLLVPMPVSGQTAKGAAPTKGTAQQWTPPRTPDGQPDIQGLWDNIDSFFTPYERPSELKENLSEQQQKAILEQLAQKRVEGGDGGVGAGPTHWYEYKTGHVESAASLVVKPSNGRVPAMTPWAEEKVSSIRSHGGGWLTMIAPDPDVGGPDSYEVIETGDRCISRGILGDMIPTNYNNGKQILQTPGYVVILSEMIHDARIIPLERPHVDAKIGQWMGDPRGHWEGNTLVVESTNFNAKAPVRRIGVQTEHLRMVERFTTVGPDTLNYEVTIEDPTVYVAPWSIAFPFKRDNEYKMFEYACHEGNYSIPHTLSGARAQEKERVKYKSPK